MTTSAAPAAAIRPPRPHPPSATAPVWHRAWDDPAAWAVFLSVTTGFLWLRGGGWQLLRPAGEGLWLAAGQLAGLVAALAALAGLVLVARPARLEHRYGLDRMIRWHRWIGMTTIAALLVHIPASTIGFAGGRAAAAPGELSRLLADEPWMVAALAGTVLMSAVALTSWRRIKSRLPYETWYLLHLNGYLAVVLGFGHQVTLGQTFAADPVARGFWVALLAATAAVVVWSRLGGLVRSGLRGTARVADVHRVARGTVAVTLTGTGADRLRAAAGQFVSARFLTRELWWQSHPFSLSAAPGGGTLRLTIKDLGDATARIPTLPVGSRVLLQGPYGCMRLDAEPQRRLVLIGAGVGVAPLVALLQSCGSWRRPVVLLRGHDTRDIAHLAELRRLVAARQGRLFVITGPRGQWRAGNPFTAANLRARIPDLGDRAAFVCGPPALQAAAVSGLRRAGMPAQHIHSERFGW